MADRRGDGARPGALLRDRPEHAQQRPEANAYEVRHLRSAELRVIPGVRGHFAGGGVNPEDTRVIDAALRDLLAD